MRRLGRVSWGVVSLTEGHEARKEHGKRCQTHLEKESARARARASERATEREQASERREERTRQRESKRAREEKTERESEREVLRRCIRCTCRYGVVARVQARMRGTTYPPRAVTSPTHACRRVGIHAGRRVLALRGREGCVLTYRHGAARESRLGYKELSHPPHAALRRLCVQAHRFNACTHVSRANLSRQRVTGPRRARRGATQTLSGVFTSVSWSSCSSLPITCHDWAARVRQALAATPASRALPRAPPFQSSPRRCPDPCARATSTAAFGRRSRRDRPTMTSPGQ